MNPINKHLTLSILITCFIMTLGGCDDTDSSSAGEVSAGEATAGEATAGEAPAGEAPAGEEPAGEEPAGEEPAGEEPAGENPAGENPAGEEPAGEEPAGEEPAGEEPAGEEPAGEEPAGEEPAGEEPAGEEPAGEEPAGEEPAGEEPAGEVVAPEIVGDYLDNYMGSHVITDTTWTQGYEGGAPSVFHFRAVDNDLNFLVAENDAMNEFAPSLFSRFDWAEVEGTLWFCQTTFDAESVEAAIAVPASDSTDPSTSGCSGFSWSSLSLTE